MNWEESNLPGTRKVVHSGTEFTESWDWGLFMRVGWNKYNLVCRYRMSPLLTEGNGIPDMVPLTLGLQLGLHK